MEFPDELARFSCYGEPNAVVHVHIEGCLTGLLLLTIMSSRKLPSFDELPKFHNFSGCAWDVWGKDDELGTVNLLTEDVVKIATEEIK